MPEAATAPATETPANAVPPVAAAAPVIEKAAPVVSPAAAAKDQPPAEITYALKAPEGYAAEEVTGVLEFAKAHKLAPEAAQALLDAQAKRDSEFDAAVKESQVKVVTDQQALWETTAKADKVIGGQSFDANLKRIHDVVSKYGDAEFAKEVIAAGARVPPGFLRLIHNFAAATADDSLTRGKNPPGNTIETGSFDQVANRIYGNSAK